MRARVYAIMGAHKTKHLPLTEQTTVEWPKVTPSNQQGGSLQNVKQKPEVNDNKKAVR